AARTSLRATNRHDAAAARHARHARHATHFWSSAPRRYRDTAAHVAGHATSTRLVDRANATARTVRATTTCQERQRHGQEPRSFHPLAIAFEIASRLERTSSLHGAFYSDFARAGCAFCLNFRNFQQALPTSLQQQLCRGLSRTCHVTG